MINVLLAEDQSMVRGALTALLNMEKDICVVAEVGNGKASLDYLTAEAEGVSVR